MSATAPDDKNKTKASRRSSVTKNKTSTRSEVAISEAATTEATTTEAAKYAALATHYKWTKAVLMILFNYMVLWALVWNFKQFKPIENFKEPITDKHLRLLRVMNFGSLATGSIDFGRPYLPSILCFTGILVIAFGLRNYGGLVKWAETFFTILLIWRIILEYFYIGYQYWLFK